MKISLAADGLARQSLIRPVEWRAPSQSLPPAGEKKAAE